MTDAKSPPRCHFLELPAELRNHVYEHVFHVKLKRLRPKLSQHTKPSCYYELLCDQAACVLVKNRFVPSENHRYRVPSILGVCRRIAKETLGFWYPRLHFEKLNGFNDGLSLGCISRLINAFGIHKLSMVRHIDTLFKPTKPWNVAEDELQRIRRDMKSAGLELPTGVLRTSFRYVTHSPSRYRYREVYPYHQKAQGKPQYTWLWMWSTDPRKDAMSCREDDTRRRVALKESDEAEFWASRGYQWLPLRRPLDQVMPEAEGSV